ncbi:MAG: DUF2723 domain-containing protein [Caldilineales bacterium]|nr:DUF2723 domain-containing protein [Caldilineales bacterium]
MMRFFSLDRRGLIGLIGLLACAAILYFVTLDNGISPGDLMGGDLITHQYAQVQARPSNAPGYPLYTMGGWLWFHGWRLLLPGANPTAILSSYSTLWSLLSLALLFMLLYKLTAKNLIVSFGLGAYYAVTYFFWYYSVTSEQYTSAVLLTLGIVALALAWDQAPKDAYLVGLAFLFGVALAHLVTVLFVAPGVLAFVLTKQPDLLKRPKLILKAIFAALIPLLSYAFVYMRGAQHPEWRGQGDWTTAGQWFLDFISTQQGRNELTWALSPLGGGFPEMVWAEISIVILALGVVGWALLGQRHLLLFGSTAIIYALFSFIDRFGNWYQVIMPLYPLFLLGAGVSLARLWRTRPQTLWRVAITLGLLALLVAKFIATYPLADQRNRTEDTALDAGRALAAEAPPEAIILAETGQRLALDYLAIVWDERDDLTIINTKQLANALAAGEPVLVTKEAAVYAARETRLPLRYNSWGGDLLQVATDRLPPPQSDLVAVDRMLGDGLRLVGYRLQPGDAPDAWEVDLAIKADSQPIEDWAVSVRLLSGDAEIAQQDHPAPALGFTPTSSLSSGDTAFDSFRFAIDPARQIDAARLIIYRPLPDGSFVNLAEFVLEPTITQQ